jgi:HlyD family secretion protein
MRGLAILLLTAVLAACGDDPRGTTFQGYVEGEFVQVAPEVGGRIVGLAVDRGDTVEQGDPLFRIASSEAESSVAQARAELARAKAQLANLKEGQRPPEIAVIEAQIAEAEASLDQAEREFERQLALFDRRVVSEARLDQAREGVRVGEARVAAAQRQKEVATLPARTPEIEAGERAVEAARAALDMAETRLAKHAVAAPVAGHVEDVFYEAGEVASAGAPVLSLLPDGARKVIFFVPEPARAAVPIGSTVAVSCDGCPAGATARVKFLATEAEFTPPVIFSRDTREKLVFRAEAALGDEAQALPLGQPVDVTPMEAGAS